jgi:hypothetical protein
MTIDKTTLVNPIDNCSTPGVVALDCGRSRDTSKEATLLSSGNFPMDPGPISYLNIDQGPRSRTDGSAFSGCRQPLEHRCSFRFGRRSIGGFFRSFRKELCVVDMGASCWMLRSFQRARGLLQYVESRLLNQISALHR